MLSFEFTNVFDSIIQQTVYKLAPVGYFLNILVQHLFTLRQSNGEQITGNREDYLRKISCTFRQL